MTERHADRLRDEAGALEAQIEALGSVREVWSLVHKTADCPPVLAEYAVEQMDKLDDQIGTLRLRINALDDEIHDADPERPHQLVVL